MASYVSSGALMMCTMGMAPSSLTITPDKNIFTEGKPIAGVKDHQPMTNVAPFCLCASPTCPTFIKVSGTPGPCQPNLPAPWVPGNPTVEVTGITALNDSSKLQCVYGGSISFLFAGQLTVQL